MRGVVAVADVPVAEFDAHAAALCVAARGPVLLPGEGKHNVLFFSRWPICGRRYFLSLSILPPPFLRGHGNENFMLTRFGGKQGGGERRERQREGDREREGLGGGSSKMPDARGVKSFDL